MTIARTHKIETHNIAGIIIDEELVTQGEQTSTQFIVHSLICETLEIAILAGLCVRAVGKGGAFVLLPAILRMLKIPSKWTE